ncbi:MAG: ATP-binding protein [Bacteroidetes bacterium]|nr:MAG: ATP-binding protein [Bacteroidota bacterium]
MKTLADHILDIVQNSVRANATLIEIIVEEDKKNDLCLLKINDNGCGMSAETLEKATNPFFTTRNTRKVGLGLSLLKQNAEMANGRFKIQSELKKGTEVEATFQHSHFDRPELGEVWDTYYLTMLGNKNVEFIYEHKTNKGSFRITSAEIRKSTEGISLQQTEIRKAITDLIKNNITDIQ